MAITVVGYGFQVIHKLWPIVHQIYHVENSNKEVIFKFIGKLLDDRPEGRGIAKYLDGKIYEGEFRKGTRNGSGTLYGKDNSILREGQWKNNLFIVAGNSPYYKIGLGLIRRDD